MLKLLKTRLLTLLSPRLFLKEDMLLITLLLDLVLILWDSEESNLTMMMSHPEVEEEVEAVEVAVEEEVDKTKVLDKEDKIQNKPLRKLKKISQPYEHEDLFDLLSKELADSV